MDNLLSVVFPKAKTISPVAMNAPQVENVPSDNYLDRVYNYGIAPPHYARTAPMCATSLPPSPRDSNNLTIDPACSTCKNYPQRPFKRNKCYMMYSPEQNMWGPVCGDGGYNANWVRGNRFGVDYDYKKVFQRPNFAIDVPTFRKENPVVVADDPNYPFEDYPLRYNKWYKTYGLKDNFVRGKPTFTFPYSVLNRESGVLVKEGFDGDGSTVYQSNKKYVGMGVMIFFIVIMILLLMVFMKL